MTRHPGVGVPGALVLGWRLVVAGSMARLSGVDHDQPVRTKCSAPGEGSSTRRTLPSASRSNTCQRGRARWRRSGVQVDKERLFTELVTTRVRNRRRAWTPSAWRPWRARRSSPCSSPRSRCPRTLWPQPPGSPALFDWRVPPSSTAPEASSMRRIAGRERDLNGSGRRPAGGRGHAVLDQGRRTSSPARREPLPR